MTNPPLSSTTPTMPTKGEPIKEGIVPHLRRIDDLIRDLGNEITGLQRIEQALKEAHSRLERHTGLMHSETQLIEQLLKRDARPAPPIRSIATDALAEKVENDLNRLTSAFTNDGNNTNPVAIPLPKR